MKKVIYLLTILVSIALISAKDETYPGSIKQISQIDIKAPIALTTDGYNLFIIDKEKTMIYQMNLKNKTLSEYIITPGTNPSSMTSDGKYIYILDNDDKAIYKIDIPTKQMVRRLEIDVDMPLAIAYGDGSLFINDLSKKTINRIDVNDATTISTIPMPTAGKGRSTEEYGMVYKKGYLYITDRNTDSIYQVYVKTGDVVNIYHIPELPFMTGITFDNDEITHDNDDLLVLDLERKALARINIKAEKTAYRRNQKTEIITYKEKYKNFGPNNIDKTSISIAIPKNLPNQDILSVEFTPSKYENVKDRWGQEFAHFTFKNVKPQELVTAEMKVKANIYEIRYFIDPEIIGPLSYIPQDIRENFLKDDLKYSLSDPAIQNAVKEAVQDEKNPYWIARRIYKYVQEKMYYELSGGWNIAPTVLKRGSGSCSEYSFVYIAMCRAAGIPTRFAGSVVIRGDDASYDDVFHRWVEIYLPNYGWIPVDPSGGDEIEPEKQAEFFGGLKNKFLITTIGAGSSEYLGWEYNSSSSYNCTGRCKIMRYKGGKWEPVGKKYEKSKESIFSPSESSSRGCH